MTFQEAQARFSAIVAGIGKTTPKEVLLQKMRDLDTLRDSLPNTAEFDPIADAIVEHKPKLSGQITDKVIESLQSRDAAFKETAGLLTQVGQKAAKDARTLSFEKPKLVLAALEKSVETLKEIRADSEAKKFQDAAMKTEALLALIEQARLSIKAT